jgi:hypothetical protein
LTKKIGIAVVLFAVSAFGQFSWPTYPVHSKTQIYKVLKDNGSGVAVLATDDGTTFLGINQNAVTTSTGSVQIQTSGPSQVQVGSTPVAMGGEITADGSGNVTPFSPAADGSRHCYLGTVIGLGTGAGAANSFVYVNISPVCATSSSAGGVTSFNTRTGAVVSATADYSVGQVTGAAPLASPSFTGTVTLPSALTLPPTQTISPTSGGTIALSTNGAVTDFSIANGLGGSEVDWLSSGTLALSGVSVTAPTPTASDSSTKVATTAFVAAKAALNAIIGSTSAFPTLPSAKVALVVNTATINGNTDLYTVPAGKRAVFGGFIFNTSGGTLTAQPQYKISGTYVALSSPTTSITNNTATTFLAFNTLPIAEAGDVISFGTTGVMQVFGVIITFNNTEGLLSPRLTTFTTGDNTLFTCPASTTCFITNGGGGGNAPYRTANNSGGTRTYHMNAVLSGQSPTATNQLGAAFTTTNANSTAASFVSLIGLGPGDFLNVNVDAGTATQFFYIPTIVEIPQ